MNTQTETNSPPAKKKCCAGCKAGMQAEAPCRRKATTKTEKRNETGETIDRVQGNP